MRTDTITIDDHNSDENFLLHTYPQQTDRQPCYIEFDLKNHSVYADWNAEIGNAVPTDVWHGFHRRYEIPALTRSAALDAMRTLLPLFERVAAGFEEAWDGNNNVGRLTEDAQTAEEEISNSLTRDWEPEELAAEAETDDE